MGGQNAEAVGRHGEYPSTREESSRFPRQERWILYGFVPAGQGPLYENANGEIDVKQVVITRRVRTPGGNSG